MTDNAHLSLTRQYNLLRHGCGFVELADWSSIALTGADRQKFLNNFCTNDVKLLKPGDSCEAFFCNVKGKTLGHGLVTCRDDALGIIGPPGQAATLADHLERYVIREDVQICNTSVDRAYFLVTGQASICDRLRLTAGHGSAAVFPWKLIVAEFAALLELPSSDVRAIQDSLIASGCQHCDVAAFQAARIEAGMPLFGIDFDDHALPQEIGRNEQAISFTKGCYLGQETVARLDALGHVNQQLVGVAFAGGDVPPRDAELLHGGASVGRVTSSTFSPALGRPLALAMVRREHGAVGTPLESRWGPCHVVALPVSATPAAS